MNEAPLNILLADDDPGDLIIFREALRQIHVSTNLSTVDDGEELMRWLHANNKQLPDVIFLDQNMPRKSGKECLLEIKQDKKLMHIPIIICSTSYLETVADVLYHEGAFYYIQKPVDFEVFVSLVQSSLSFIEGNLASIKEGALKQPSKEHFLLHELSYH